MTVKQQYEILIRNELRSLGCNKQFTDEQLKKRDRRDNAITSDIEDYELLLLSNLFYSIVHRIFPQNPREVVKYEGFDDKGNSLGIANIEEKIVSGAPLVPHMSKSVFDVDQARNNDPMFNEWGIYHFHIPPTDGNGTFTTRSEDLLFAIVTGEQFIFLDIQPHSEFNTTYDPWIDVRIIEKIEEHYPELSEQYYLGDGKAPLTDEQRKNLRARNANTNIVTTNGREYRLPGCGSVAAGLPLSSIIRSDKNIDILSRLPENSTFNLSFDKNYDLKVEEI